MTDKRDIIEIYRKLSKEDKLIVNRVIMNIWLTGGLKTPHKQKKNV